MRWYCRFRLSLADVRDLLAERGIDVSPRTILTWVQKFGPLLAAAVRRAARPVGRRWYCDETYVRVAGAWAYLYRAVDEYGQVVDVLLRAQRDLASARAFFAQAIDGGALHPDHVVTDKHRAYVRAVRRHARRAVHTRTGLHRARGETTKAVERVARAHQGPAAADARPPVDRIRTAAARRHRGRPGGPPGRSAGHPGHTTSWRKGAGPGPDRGRGPPPVGQQLALHCLTT